MTGHKGQGNNLGISDSKTGTSVFYGSIYPHNPCLFNVCNRPGALFIYFRIFVRFPNRFFFSGLLLESNSGSSHYEAPALSIWPWLPTLRRTKPR